MRPLSIKSVVKPVSVTNDEHLNEIKVDLVALVKKQQPTI